MDLFINIISFSKQEVYNKYFFPVAPPRERTHRGLGIRNSAVMPYLNIKC